MTYMTQLKKLVWFLNQNEIWLNVKITSVPLFLFLGVCLLKQQYSNLYVCNFVTLYIICKVYLLLGTGKTRKTLPLFFKKTILLRKWACSNNNRVWPFSLPLLMEKFPCNTLWSPDSRLRYHCLRSFQKSHSRADAGQGFEIFAYKTPFKSSEFPNCELCVLYLPSLSPLSPFLFVRSLYPSLSPLMKALIGHSVSWLGLRWKTVISQSVFDFVVCDSSLHQRYK